MLGSAPGAAIGGEPAGREPPPRPLPPTAPSAPGPNPGPAPRALAGDIGKAPAEGREGQALTHAESGPAFESPCRGPHPGPQGHLPVTAALPRAAHRALPVPEQTASRLKFSLCGRARPGVERLWSCLLSPPPASLTCPRCPSPSPEFRASTRFQKHLGHDTYPPIPKDRIPSVCSSQLLSQLRRPLPQPAP